MNALRIPMTAKTPEIIFDRSGSYFEIRGRSIPDNAEAFYLQALEWFDDYVVDPLEETVLKINLEYFNISSSKQLLSLLYKLNDIASKKTKVRVKWYYNEVDEDMFEVGQDYAFMVKIPFDFVSHSTSQNLVESP